MNDVKIARGALEATDPIVCVINNIRNRTHNTLLLFLSDCFKSDRLMRPELIP